MILQETEVPNFKNNVRYARAYVQLVQPAPEKRHIHLNELLRSQIKSDPFEKSFAKGRLADLRGVSA